MLVLGLRLFRFMGQVQFGGADRKTNLFCTSCYFYNSYQRDSKTSSAKDGTGWYNHTRSTCSWRSSCPLPADEVTLKTFDAELRKHLRLHGLYGPEEQRNEEQRKAEKSAGGRPARSVSMSDEPERKKQKKEKAEAKKKEEEAKKKKEMEDLRSQLQSESEIILHGYLFDETFRCETPAIMAIDLRNERMRAEEERRRNPVQDAAEAERSRKEKEEEAKEGERLKHKEQCKAARQADKKKRRKRRKKAKKAEKNQEKKEKKKRE